MKTLMFGTIIIVSLAVQFSLQATDNGVPAVLTMMAVDVELNETEHRRVQLSEVGGASSDPALLCTPDAGDSDPVRAYIESATPSAPCGKNCFSLQPCGSSGEHCLFYLPGVDILSVALAPRYTLILACTDDAEVKVTGTMTVTLISNTPPVFVPASPLSVSETIDGLTSPPGTLIYNVSSFDVDNDFVNYTMSLSPVHSSGYFYMMNNGQLKTAQDLRLYCENGVTASVIISDGFNSPVRPFTLGLTLDPSNEAPSVTNLDTTVTYREKPGAGYTVLDLAVVDTSLSDVINIHMWANSSAGMELYGLSGTRLQTKLNPKYAREDLRSVTLYFQLDDGFCSSPTYSLTVEVQDFNERPRVYTTQPFLEAYEGEIDIPHNIEIIDEEQVGGFTYALSRSNDVFDVDPTTGNIVTRSGVTVDVDQQDNIYEDFTVGVYAYDDAGRRSDEATVLVRVYDKNDNPPYFIMTSFNMAANECMEPGSIIGRLEGQDDDSRYNQNNFFYFGGGGSHFAVMATGDVVLVQNCTDGETFSGTATIHDQGIYPGTLRGDPAIVVVTCGPCIVTTTASPLIANPTTISREVYVCLVLSSALTVAWLSLTVILALKTCYFRKQLKVWKPKPPLLQSQKMSTVSKPSHHTVTTISDGPRSPPVRRMSTVDAPDSLSRAPNGKKLSGPPFLVKHRKSTNPFFSWNWKQRVMAFYRKPRKSSKESTHNDLQNDFSKSRQITALTIEPLTEIETASMTSEARDEMGSLPTMKQDNRTAQDNPRASVIGSGGVRFTAVQARQNRSAQNNPRGIYTESVNGRPTAGQERQDNNYLRGAVTVAESGNRSTAVQERHIGTAQDNPKMSVTEKSHGSTVSIARDRGMGQANPGQTAVGNGHESTSGMAKQQNRQLE